MPKEHPKTEKKRRLEEDEILAHSAISAHAVHEAILIEGDRELARPNAALAFSGVAAGLSMGFSLVAQGLLQAHLPDTEWRPLISKLGYSVGFLIVVLGRQQLFTENTLTPVLSLLHNKHWRVFANVMRLWAIVLAANLLGAILFAYGTARTPAFEEDVKQAFAEIGRAPFTMSFGTTLVRGIFAGWLIALMVWLLPFAETARVWVIILLAYIIGLGHFPHIIAGSTDVLYLVATQERTWGEYATRFFIPTLIGNIVGGVLLVTAINHAQVKAGSADGA